MHGQVGGPNHRTFFTRWLPSRRFFSQDIVQAPDAGPGCEEVEKKEAIQDRRLTVIRQWPGSAGEVPHEVSDSHFTTENEGHGSCEQTEDEQSPADNFESARDPKE